MMQLVPVEERTDPREVQIEALEVLPIVNGKAVCHCSGFEIIVDKVKITYSDPDAGWAEKTEEFDAKDVKLSGWPAGS